MESGSSFALQAVSNGDNSGFADISVSISSSSTFNLTTLISEGKLKGLLDLRDTLLPSYINQMDQLSATVINEINQQHRAGFGLDGSTGVDFFSPLSPAAAIRLGSVIATAIDPAAP